MYKTLKFYDKKGVTRYQTAFVAVYENAFIKLSNLARHFYGVIFDARLLTKTEQADIWRVKK